MYSINKNVTQHHGEIPNLKHNLLSSESAIANPNIENKQRNTEKLSYQTFSPEKKFEAKAIKILVHDFLPVEKFDIYYLNACYRIHILSYTQNLWERGFRPLLKQMNFHCP